MEPDRFDDLITRLTLPMSRRRGVGLAGVLGLAGLVAPPGADARKKKRKKKRKKPKPTSACRASCAGRTCGDDGCGGSCGTCEGELVCRNGRCDCPEGQDLCGGTCHPACPASSPGREVARHPATCECCVRPGSFPCPYASEQCCIGPEDLPCCALPCEPLAVNGECPVGIDPEWYGTAICHYDVECYPGYRCPEGNDPRLCEPIPG
jgi:hypothetical protein